MKHGLELEEILMVNHGDQNDTIVTVGWPDVSAPPFVFNHRTGDVTKDGIVAPLSALQARIFGALALATANGVPIGIGAVAKAIGEHVDDIEDELPSLIHILKRLGIRIAHERGKGRWLEFGPPPKFEVKIPPPVRLEGEVP